MAKGVTETASSAQRKGSQSRTSSAQYRPVARPTPKTQAEDPRAFQVGQLQRRFKADRSDGSDASTVLIFKMEPAPDFPYAIEALECLLTVPATYPTNGNPKLLIKNNDIPRGFQINIERGFDQITADAPNATLLGLMNRLDRQLETILAGRTADTVKIVANRGTTKPAIQQDAQFQEPAQVTEVRDRTPCTKEDLDVAQQQRQLHLRQLEARFSRLRAFAKSADGLTYTVPLDSPKRSAWPEALQSLKTIQITVPQLYPIAPADLHLDNESDAARAVEAAFSRRSMEHSGSTLTQHINHLSLNLRDMSIAVPEKSEGLASRPVPVQAANLIDKEATEKDDSESIERNTHLHYIPRPPEWSVSGNSDESDSDSNGYNDSEIDEADEETTTRPDEPSEAATTSAPAERGILLSFPHLDIHGIELLELTSLQITVKCERCKDIMDIGRLRSSEENGKMREESCKKCAAGFALRFRADMIHANSVRAGYLDLEGCTVVDMLPSSFIPTCAECSTSLPAPGVVAVRGDSALAICRECHRKMSFRIFEVKFLQISASATGMALAPGRKKARENLGITTGTALPQQGRCSHYRKSYRWFRFSCCNKVFACDRCHDEKEDHPNEWANRILCGYCSREQNFRPDDCGICHAALTGKRGRGFWEGGKGTRDPAKMSRKDPRKYKRRPGTKPPA